MAQYIVSSLFLSYFCRSNNKHVLVIFMIVNKANIASSFVMPSCSFLLHLSKTKTRHFRVASARQLSRSRGRAPRSKSHLGRRLKVTTDFAPKLHCCQELAGALYMQWRHLVPSGGCSLYPSSIPSFIPRVEYNPNVRLFVDLVLGFGAFSLGI